MKLVVLFLALADPYSRHLHAPHALHPQASFLLSSCRQKPPASLPMSVVKSVHLVSTVHEYKELPWIEHTSLRTSQEYPTMA